MRKDNARCSKAKTASSQRYVISNMNEIPLFANYDGGHGFIYNNRHYFKFRDVGEGTSGVVSRFSIVQNDKIDSALPSASSPSDVVVKAERFTARVGYCEVESFSSEAKFNQAIYGLGEFSGNRLRIDKPHFVLMPYFPGVLLSNIKFETLSATVTWFLRIAYFVHEKMHRGYFNHPKKKVQTGLVHGDLKRDNIILYGNDVKIIDFGLTTYIDDDLTPYEIPRDARGKPQSFETVHPHIAPELSFAVRCQSRTFAKSHSSQDVYALGYVLRLLIDQVIPYPAAKLPEKIDKIKNIIHEMRYDNCNARLTLPVVIEKLSAIIAVVPALLSQTRLPDRSKVESSKEKTEQDDNASQAKDKQSSQSVGAGCVIFFPQRPPLLQAGTHTAVVIPEVQEACTK